MIMSFASTRGTSFERIASTAAAGTSPRSTAATRASPQGPAGPPGSPGSPGAQGPAGPPGAAGPGAAKVNYNVPANTPAFKVDMVTGGTTTGVGQVRFLRFHPYGVSIESSITTTRRPSTASLIKFNFTRTSKSRMS